MLLLGSVFLCMPLAPLPLAWACPLVEMALLSDSGFSVSGFHMILR